MFSDYHVHSSFSFDSEESPRAIVEKAIALGMKQICFTDHQDFNWPIEGESPYIDFPKYFEVLNSLRNEYSSKINILKGVELGLTSDNFSLCHKLLDSYDFDFVIGSCHIVDQMDPYYAEFWEGKNDRDCFELYFKTLLEGLLEFSQIDTLGHLDYVVRYSPNRDSNYSPFDYQDVIDEILKFIIEKDIKLEINTSNLSKGFNFFNPHTDIIKRYKELGGEIITVGSDAHYTEYLADHIDFAYDILKKAGFDYVCTFREKKPIFNKLP